jgi:hypothetical protein
MAGKFLNDGSPDGPAGEDTPAQEATFQGAVAMHAPASKARRLARGIQTVYWRSGCIQYLALQIGFESAKGLAGDDMQSYCDEWSSGGVQYFV